MLSYSYAIKKGLRPVHKITKKNLFQSSNIHIYIKNFNFILFIYLFFLILTNLYQFTTYKNCCNKIVVYYKSLEPEKFNVFSGLKHTFNFRPVQKNRKSYFF